VSELVCEVTGGPCKYTGKNMKDAHAHLHITETEWKIMAADFKKSLDKFKVPQTEQKELFDIVGKTKADIVTIDDTEASEKKPKK
jgi:hemoglobin